MKTDTAAGALTKSILVYTNDPQNPRTELQVTAIIVGSVLVLPQERIWLSDAGPPNRLSERLLVRRDPTEEGELEVLALTPSEPWLGVTATRVTEPLPPRGGLPEAQPGDWILDVSVKDDAPWGTHSEFVTFATGLAREPRLTIPVRVILRSPVNLSTQELRLEPSAGGGSAGTLLMTVDAEAGEPSFETRPEGLVLAHEKTGARHHRLQVHWNGGERPSDAAVLIRVAGKTVEVPVILPKTPTGGMP